MTTAKQWVANQLNAKKSTGPKTPAGKRKSRGNALTHGLFAEDLLVYGEKTEVFEDYKKSMIDNLDPQNALEEECALQIINTGWNIRRGNQMESGIIGKFQQEAYQYKSKSHEREFFEQTFKGTVNEVSVPTEVLGDAFIRDCRRENAVIKLSTIKQRNLNQYYKLLEIYDGLKRKHREEA